MGKHISYDDNPLGSVILNVMMLMGKRAKTDSIKNLIKLKCYEELKETLTHPTQIIYLDFSVDFDTFGDKCEITANNIMSALWFCGIYPFDSDIVMSQNKYYPYEDEKSHYKFNEKTKRLKFFKK